MNEIIFIVGPTAVGKTQTAYILAKETGSRIISCDSMLVYKEPSIITSKPAKEILGEVKHDFVGIISVEDDYSAFDYYRGASKKITDLYKKGVPVVVCGGSGLYAKSLLDGIFEGPGKDEKLRFSLEEEARKHGSVFLHNRLKEIDAQAGEKISPNDLRRIIRALEVYYASKDTITRKKKTASGLYGKLPVRIFGLGLSREALYRRINRRVEEMFEDGAIGEVEGLLKHNLSLTAGKIIGIREIKGILDKTLNPDKAKEEMKKNTRHLAKRQMTWFKADKRVEWIDMDNLTPHSAAKEISRRIEAGK